MTAFLTWQYVSTFMGLCFSTSIVVEFLKEIPLIKKIPTKYFACIIAFLLLLFCSVIGNTFVVMDIPLMLLNAILITFTTTGQYDFTYRKVRMIEKKPEDEKETIK